MKTNKKSLRKPKPEPKTYQVMCTAVASFPTSCVATNGHLYPTSAYSLPYSLSHEPIETPIVRDVLVVPQDKPMEYKASEIKITPVKKPKETPELVKKSRALLRKAFSMKPTVKPIEVNNDLGHNQND